MATGATAAGAPDRVWATPSREGVSPVGRQRAESAMACAPCVARPSPLPERVAAMASAIEAEVEPLVTLTHLLQLCRDEHAVLWERVNDPDAHGDRLAETLADLRSVLPAASSVAALSPEVRRALAGALSASSGVPAVLVANALAELIDERYAHSFAESFSRRSPYRPGVGDPVPLDSPDLRQVTVLSGTSPPWRLANRLDETRHVRLAGEWASQFQVIFDYSLAEHLGGIVGPDTIVATCHPNRSLAELRFPLDARGASFPVQPADEQRQKMMVDRLIGAAVAAGASVVVLPELCLTESMAAQLQGWTCREDGPRLLVAGSYHQEGEHPSATLDGHAEPSRRRNRAVAYLRNHPAPLVHDKHSPADRPVNEDIQPQGWPQLRVYVSCDGWHLVIAICRDLLNPHAVHALAEAGVNLVLVPAMSETLIAFGGPVAHLVGSSQAFVAVANNPADFADVRELRVRRPARALFGHPGFGQQTKLVQPVGGEPGVALLRIRTGQLTWLPDMDSMPEPQHSQPGTPPPWAAQLARQTATPLPRPGRQPARITLRPAAVLLLLTDTPAGPAALLTERAPDLPFYPGQLVFPGGAAEPGDDGPVTTALREACEEVGLDPASVTILGALPAVALPDSGFLLTPVLAWSARPTFTSSANLAEVNSLATVPLAHLTQPEPGWPGVLGGDAAPEGAPVSELLGNLGAVTRVLIDLVTGMLTHADLDEQDANHPRAATRRRTTNGEDQSWTEAV